MKIAVLYPPQGDPCQPYSAPAYLASVLLQQGHEVQVFDFNLAFFDDVVLSRDNIANVLTRAEHRLAELEMYSELAPERAGEYEKIGRAVLSGKFVHENLERAKSILRGQDFYHINKYNWAFQVFERAFELSACLAHPTRFDLQHFDSIIDWENPFGDKRLLADPRANFFLEPFRQHFVRQILCFTPDLVAISVTYPTQVLGALTLAMTIKEVMPDIHIAMGGATLSRMLEDRMPSGAGQFLDYADSLVIYEGEDAICEIVRQLQKNGGVEESVPNALCRRKSDGAHLIGELRVVHNFKELPDPAYHLFPLEKYYSPEPVLLLEAARGCYWECAFCRMGAATHGPTGTSYRVKDPVALVTQATRLQELTGARRFYIDSLALTPRWLSDFSHAIVNAGLDITWDTEIRIDGRLTPELCRKMYEAGCRHLRFGFESASDRVLELMHKGTTREVSETVFENCTNAGIHVSAMSFVGFPTETFEEAWRTAGFLERMGSESKIDFCPVSSFSLERGSEVDQQPEKYSIEHIYREVAPAFSTRYRYTTSVGLSQFESLAVAEDINDQLTNLFPARDLLSGGGLGHCHTHLYAARHHRHSLREEFKKLLTQISPIEAIPDDFQSTGRFYWRRFRFDMQELSNFLRQAEQDALRRLTAFPLDESTIRKSVALKVRESGLNLESECYVIFNEQQPDTYHFLTLPMWSLLSICLSEKQRDGALEKLLREFSSEGYCIEDCLGAVRTLFNNGILESSVNGQASSSAPSSGSSEMPN